MRHIIISDTHSPYCINKIYKSVSDIITKTKIDKIVINGDLLGIFSMAKSKIHQKVPLNMQILNAYLKDAAPNFYEQYSKTKIITEDLVVGYVKERYDWCYNIIEKFNSLCPTYFNMGNHESPYHFLVLQEISFLTQNNSRVPSNIDHEKLKPIFDEFESKLENLEKNTEFKYLRHNVIVDGNTIIIGIPGENHATSGSDPLSVLQENKTKEKIELARNDVNHAFNIIIYNHTQGSYDRETGNFECASISLKEFMHNLPINIFNKVFVQSHNHWGHTQYLKNKDFEYILNNAGLHNGIYNIIDINQKVTCFDVDSNTNEITKLEIAKPSEPISREDIIKRNYPNHEQISKRNG